jgi:hypothetical protein
MTTYVSAAHVIVAHTRNPMRALPASSPAPPAASARAAARAPLTVWLYIACTWLLGWWMAFDGLHQRLFGDYVRIGGQLGPWAGLAQALGVDPQRLGLTFVAVGLGLIGASFGVYLRRRWGYVSALLLAAVCLLYLGFGTPVALLSLIFLLLKPTRAYIAP